MQLLCRGISALSLAAMTISFSNCNAHIAQMNDSRLPYVQISKAEKDKLLEEGYNPLEPGLDEQKFADEWNAIFDSVKSEVSSKWKFGFRDGDFFMSSDWAPDRFLAIEVANERMVTTELVDQVHKILLKWDADYAVDICDAWGFMQTSDGQPYPHFNIIVTKTRVMIYSESNNILSRFGLVAR